MYVDAYKNFYKHFIESRKQTDAAFPISIEFLGASKENAEDALKLICNNWGLEYKEAMLNTEWANAMIRLDYTRSDDVENVFKKNKTGLHDNAMKGGGFKPSEMYPGILSSEEYKIINRELKPLHDHMIQIMHQDLKNFKANL